MYLYISRRKDIYQIINNSYLWEIELMIGGRDDVQEVYIMLFYIGFFSKAYIAFVIIIGFLKILFIYF